MFQMLHLTKKVIQPSDQLWITNHLSSPAVELTAATSQMLNVSMQDKNTTIALYAAGAALAALSIAYIFGPSIFPDDAGYQDARLGGVVGLSNPANDCFINSVLQALASIEGLKAYLTQVVKERVTDSDSVHVARQDEKLDQDEKHDEKHARLQKELVVTIALKDILERLSERPACRKTISAREFISTLEHVFGRYVNRRQQDAQEFLQIVLEKLEDEHLVVSKALRAESGTEGAANETIIKLPPLPIAGSISSQITCLTCNYQPKPNISPFSTLTLNVPQTSSTTLDVCLDGLLKVETIEDYICEQCQMSAVQDELRDEYTRTTNAAAKERLATVLAHLEQNHSDSPQPEDQRVQLGLESMRSTNPQRAESFHKRYTAHKPGRGRIQKHTSIANFPQVLPIHLSRSVFDSSSFSTKNMARVAFPEVLVLGGIGEKRRKYHLSSMITHRGGHNSGHYETFRRAQNDESRADINVKTETSPMGAATHNSEQAASETTHEEKATSKPKKQKSKQNDKWWRISDDKISEYRTKDMLNMQKEVYILFYELRR